MMRRLAYLLLAAIIPLSQAQAATKYLSPAGAAAWGSCTTTAAPCSIATAQSNAAAGDIIILMDGTYSTGINTATNGTLGNMITWQAQNNRRAILNGLASGATDKVVQIDNAYHKFDGLTVIVQTGPGNADTYGYFTNAATYTEVTNSEIYFGGDEALLTDDNRAYGAQFRSRTSFTRNYSHHLTYGAHFYASAAGHASYAARNVFADFTVGDEGDSDCLASNGAASGSFDFSGAIAEHNTCSGWRDDGFDFTFQDNWTVQDNVFHTPAESPGDDNSSVIKIGYEGSNGNRILRNYGYNLGTHPPQRNYGLIMTGVSDAVVAGNIMDGGYVGADIAQRNGSGGDNNRLVNNTLTNFSLEGVRVAAGADGNVFHNNIFQGGTLDINIISGATATGYHNRRVNGTDGGAGTYNDTGDTDGDPQFVGRTQPNTVDGFVCSLRARSAALVSAIRPSQAMITSASASDPIPRSAP